MKKLAMLVIVAALMSTLMGCNFWEEYDMNEEAESTNTNQISQKDNALNDKLPVVVYFADPKDKTLKKETRYITKEDGGKTIDYIAKIIVNELLKGPEQGSPIERLIPDKVQLKDLKVNISNATAIVTLSKEFADGVKGGKELEKLSVMSIVNTLTELKEIEKVKIMLENNPNGVMSGGQKLNKSFKRNTSKVAQENAASSGIVDE